MLIDNEVSVRHAGKPCPLLLETRIECCNFNMKADESGMRASTVKSWHRPGSMKYDRMACQELLHAGPVQPVPGRDLRRQSR